MDLDMQQAIASCKKIRMEKALRAARKEEAKIKKSIDEKFDAARREVLDSEFNSPSAIAAYRRFMIEYGSPNRTVSRINEIIFDLRGFGLKVKLIQ